MARGDAVVRDGTPETVEADLAVMPRRVRRSLLRQLAEGERIVIRTRRNPAVLARYALWPLAAGWLWWLLVFRVRASPGLIDLATVAVLVGLLRLAWMELERRHRWFVATNKRILKHEGVLTRRMPMMRLTKVTDMTYHRSALGELLGYGTIIIESAGQQQAIRDLTFVPDPDEVSAALNSEIFGERPRTRPGGGRTWPRIGPKRRRRGGDEGGHGGVPGPHDGGPHDHPSGTGGVEVSPAGHPPPLRTEQETWYRSANLGAPRGVRDTGEIPVVRAEVPVAQSRHQGGERELGDDAREIPLHPPRDVTERQD